MIQTTAALAVAVVTYTLVTLPPKSVRIAMPLPANAVMGAYHIHTTRSDGAGTPDEVAMAAAKAGLRFAILTDHGDATRPPDPPRYQNNVLLIDAVEISTVEGHVAALGIAGPAPYPLGGEARDVIEDVHRLGGFAIVAHPDSPREDLRWRPTGAPNGGGRGGFGPGRQGGAGDNLSGADGVEWMNADSEWRDDRSALVNAVLHLPVRPAESFATLFSRPVATMRRWDALTRRRAVVGLSAVDAHGLVAGLYTTTFQSFAQGVILDAPLSGDAAADAARVLSALRAGHAFTVVTGVGQAAMPRVIARDDTREVSMGDRLTAPTGRVVVEASVAAAPNARVVIMHNDRAVAEGVDHAEVTGPPEPGAYRAEIWLGASSRTPWIVTNPVYVDAVAAPSQTAEPVPPRPNPAPASEAVITPLAFGPEWTIEHGPSSTGTVADSPNGIAFHWNLGLRDPGMEFTALARSMGDGTESFDRVEFTASADAPMRVSVQFRLPGGRDGERWGRSAYLDSTPRTITVRMADVSPQGFSAMRRPIVARIKSLLFVIDTLNAAPGGSGTVHLSNVRLLRSSDPAASGPNFEQQVGRPGQEQQVGRPGRQGGRQ